MSEGAPIGFLWWALPTILRSRGVAVESITLLVSLLAVPWTLKFLWAPVIDLKRSTRWGTRGWILSMQFLMGLTLVPLIWLDFARDFWIVVPLLAAHAVAASTQDVSIDALCIRSTTENERGIINGWMQAGMLVGRSVFGGTTLILEHALGTQGTVMILVGTIWSVSAVVVVAQHGAEREEPPPSPREYRAKIAAILRRRTTWIGLLFAGIGGAAYEAVGSVAGPFLVDQGFSTERIGLFFAFPSVAAMLGGALLGGWISDRTERVRAVQGALVSVVLAVASVAAATGLSANPSPTLILALMTALYGAIGLFTSSSYALFMDVSDRSLGATQFSAFMAATNGCEAWSAFAVGRLIGPLGYPLAFLILAAVSAGSLPLVSRLGRAPLSGTASGSREPSGTEDHDFSVVRREGD
jgi:PAT family beta-lactamase induction signal transducer AmpG